MTLARVICAAALLAALLGAARADDPAPRKYDLRAPELWSAGDVVTETASDESSLTVTMRREGVAPNQTKRFSRNGWRIVRRCDAVAADGSPAKSLVFVAAWSNDRDGVVDTSIEGAIVETSPEGWTLLTPATRPTPAARKWLDDRCGPGPLRSDLADQSPVAPVIVGETWQPAAGTPLDDVVRGRHFPVQLTAVENRSTLASVDPSPDGDVVHVTFDAHGALAGEVKAWDGRPLVVDEGAVKARASADGVPALWRRGGRASSSGELALKATMREGVMSLDASFKYEHASVTGGELPAPPARDAAAGPRYRFAHEVTWKAGDTVTETSRTEVAMAETLVDVDGKVGKTSTNTVATSWNVVRRCVEATPDGAPLRFVVWIKDWKSEDGGKTDACLAASLVEVTAKGASLQNPDVRPTPPAKAWLDRTLGSPGAAGADDAIRSLVTPLSTMAAGEKWAPDPLAATAFFMTWAGFPLDLKGVTTSARFDAAKLEGGAVRATLAYDVHAPIKCVAGEDCTNSELQKGGTIDVSGKADGSPATWARAGEMSDETKLVVSVPAPGGGIRRISMTQKRTRTRTPGGEIPAK